MTYVNRTRRLNGFRLHRVGRRQTDHSESGTQSQPEHGLAEDFSETQIRLIGAVEVAGALRLILPAATGVAPVLTPVAAGGLAILMGGAVVTHLRRGEPRVVPLVLLVLAAGIAWRRWRMLQRSPAAR